MVIDTDDIEARQKDLRNNYIIKKKLSSLAGNAALKCGRFLALAKAMLITTKHIDFEAHLERKDEAKLKISEQSSPTVL